MASALQLLNRRNRAGGQRPAAAEPEEAVPVSSTLQLLNRNTPHQQIETAMMKRVIAPVILRRMPL
ncbi:hypothetical protein J4734_23780 [Klebsiella pneumoniae]|uniref:Uncharacterized protein n=1 Tax=Klebsiella pneumoniae TaxID=573 RepID=A0A939NPF7_KLEPN|nr:hypothetical protein [Klebsiella pneumoniae]